MYRKLLILGLVLVIVFSVSANYPQWEPYTWYNAGDIVIYEEQHYLVLQGHTSYPHWLPPNVPALYQPIDITPCPQYGFCIGEWVDVNDIVLYEEIYYRVIQAHTMQADWIPPIVPALFEPLLQYEGENPVIGMNNVTISYEEAIVLSPEAVINGLNVTRKGKSRVNIAVNSIDYNELNNSANIEVTNITSITNNLRLYKVTYETINVTHDIIENNETIGNYTEEVTIKKRELLSTLSLQDNKVSFHVIGFSEYELTDDLVAYYKLDETSGTTAEDAHGTNDLTLDGSVWTTDGKINNALSFDGSNDHAQRTSFTELEMTNFTLIAWLKPNTIVSSDYIFSFGKARYSPYYGWHFMIASDRKLQFFSGKTGGYNYVTTTGTLTANTYNFIALRFEGTTAYITINGDTETFTSQGAILYDGAYRNFKLGNIADVIQNYFLYGILDEVGIWSQALTSTEISSLYNDGDGVAYPFEFTVPPNITINTPTNTSYEYRTQLLNISSWDNQEDVNISKVWYNYNGTNVTYTEPINIVFPTGTTTIYAWANNTESKTNSTNVTFWIDNIAPNITMHSPNETNYSSRNVLVNITASDNYNYNIVYNWAGTNITYNNPVIVTFEEGNNTITAYATDNAGNVNSTSHTFEVIIPLGSYCEGAYIEGTRHFVINGLVTCENEVFNVNGSIQLGTEGQLIITNTTIRGTT